MMMRTTLSLAWDVLCIAAAPIVGFCTFRTTTRGNLRIPRFGVVVHYNNGLFSLLPSSCCIQHDDACAVNTFLFRSHVLLEKIMSGRRSRETNGQRTSKCMWNMFLGALARERQLIFVSTHRQVSKSRRPPSRHHLTFHERKQNNSLNIFLFLKLPDSSIAIVCCTREQQ